MKRFLSLFLVAVITIALFVSCGIKTEQPEATTAEQTTAQPESTTTAATTEPKKDSAESLSESSEGLEFSLNRDGKSYTLTGIGACAEKTVVVGTYNDLPVTVIGESAFKECADITGVALSNCVTKIDDYAFQGCTSLKNIRIPKSITYIGYEVFTDCDNIVYNEYDDAMYLGNPLNPYLVLIKVKNTNIISCNINTKTKIIGYRAFYYCWYLENITIPKGVVSISPRAFEACSSLVNIELPEGLTSIGTYAFCNCNQLKNVALPNSLKKIDVGAFYNCSSLIYNNYDNAKFLGSTQNPYMILVSVNDQNITSFDVNANTKFIYDNAFLDCKNLESITIPEGVIGLGDSTFWGCESLTSITLPDSIIYLRASTFGECKNLTSITMPNGINKISFSTLIGCRELKTINFKGAKAEWEAIPKENNWNFSLRNCTVICTDGNIALE